MLKEEYAVCCSIPLHQGHLLSISCNTETFKMRHFNTQWSTSTLTFITAWLEKKNCHYPYWHHYWLYGTGSYYPPMHDYISQTVSLLTVFQPKFEEFYSPSCGTISQPPHHPFCCDHPGNIKWTEQFIKFLTVYSFPVCYCYSFWLDLVC